MRILPFLLLALVVVPGCKKFPNLGGIELKDYLPKVQFDKMRVGQVDFQGVDLEFLFDVENPYPVDLRLASFEYALALQGNGFLDGRDDAGMNLKASDTVKVKMPARIGFAEALQLVGDLGSKEELDYGLTGKLGFNTPAGPLSVPVKRDGKLPVLKAPKIEPVAVRVAELRPLQNQARLEIDLAVTNNARQSAYGMKDFGYGIDLGGRRVIDGNLAELSVPAGTTEVRSVPVQLNLLQLGATLVNAITQKKPVDVHLAAGLNVDTPLGLIPLDVDETVNLRIR